MSQDAMDPSVTYQEMEAMIEAQIFDPVPFPLEPEWLDLPGIELPWLDLPDLEPEWLDLPAIEPEWMMAHEPSLNAVTHLLLPGAGLTETRYYSERIGDTTIPITTHTTNQNQPTQTHGQTRRRLITPEELRTMDDDTMLMLCKSSSPMMIKTTPYFADRQMNRLTNHPIQNHNQLFIQDHLQPEKKEIQVISSSKQKQENTAYFLPEDIDVREEI